MTHIDLLNHIRITNNLTRSELALLLNIPEKSINDVLEGKIPLTKKQLKNLSFFTGITTENIVSGNFPIITDATEAEANINLHQKLMKENFETHKFEKFMKTRTICTTRILRPCLFFFVLFLILAFLSSCIYGFGFSVISPFNSVILYTLTYIFPVLISLLSLKKLYKIAIKSSVSDEKSFKFYFTSIYLSAFVFSLFSLVSGHTKFIAFILYGVSFILPLFKTFYSTTIVSTRKAVNSNLRLFVISNFIFLATAIFCCYNLKENIILLPQYIVTTIVLFITFNILIGITLRHTYNITWRDHFGKITHIPVYKNSRKFISLISSIIIISIISSICHFGAITLYRVVEKSSTQSYTPIPREMYDKSDVNFSKKEGYTTVTQTNCSLKIPEGLAPTKETESSKLYENEKNTITVYITEDSIENADDLFDLNSMTDIYGDKADILLPVIEKTFANAQNKYGIGTQRNLYQLIVAEEAFNNTKPNYLSRGETISHLFAKIYYAVVALSVDDWYKNYENTDNNIQGVLGYHTRQSEDGQIHHVYSFYFQSIDGAESYMIYASMTDGKHNDETIYKIINSINIK